MNHFINSAKTITKKLLILLLIAVPSVFITQAQVQEISQVRYKFYPEVNDVLPVLPSPFVYNGKEYVVAITRDNHYAIMEVTLSNSRGICKQLVIDTLDFPELASHGLIYQQKLLDMSSITGWSVDTISRLGQPGGLSNSGFLAKGEDIITVMATDNQLVEQLELTHPLLANHCFMC